MRGRIMPSGITSGDPARPRSYSSTTQDHPQNLPKICIEFLDGASAWHLASPDTSSPQSWSASVRPTSATLLCMAMDAAPVAKRHVDVAAIQRLLDRIVARWNPQQVWLFGSRARGDATPDSDWDLFVVVDDSAGDDELDPGVGRHLRRECGVRADVIPWRASEFAEFRRTPNTLAYWVASEGVLLHER